MTLTIFLGLAFLFTFVVGRLVEKLRVPWIFAALLGGFLLSVHNPFVSITSGGAFEFLARTGMYLLLFMIGFELNLARLMELRGFIIRATFFIIFLEGIVGSLLVHFVFGYGWAISILVAMSFATVGEAILLPILDEFKVINTKLGQSIIGIGTLDDVIEVLALVCLMVMLGSAGKDGPEILPLVLPLPALLLGAWLLYRLRAKAQRLTAFPAEHLFVLAMSVVFIYIGVGSAAHASAIGALLAGIGVKAFIPESLSDRVELQIKTVCYGFFAPLFFIWVGATMDINYLTGYPLLILLVVAVSKGAKLLGSYIIARRELGTRHSILLGIGLSVRFSTSIVIIKILFEKGLVGSDLYSIIVASSIVFKFIVPVLFANLLVRWQVVPEDSFKRAGT